MIETLEQAFENWDLYEEWLTKNYGEFSVYELKDESGKIKIKYCKKSDFPALKDELSKAN